MLCTNIKQYSPSRGGPTPVTAVCQGCIAPVTSVLFTHLKLIPIDFSSGVNVTFCLFYSSEAAHTEECGSGPMCV